MMVTHTLFTFTQSVERVKVLAITPTVLIPAVELKPHNIFFHVLTVTVQHPVIYDVLRLGDKVACVSRFYQQGFACKLFIFLRQ